MKGYCTQYCSINARADIFDNHHTSGFLSWTRYFYAKYSSRELISAIRHVCSILIIIINIIIFKS